MRDHGDVPQGLRRHGALQLVDSLGPNAGDHFHRRVAERLLLELREWLGFNLKLLKLLLLVLSALCGRLLQRRELTDAGRQLLQLLAVDFHRLRAAYSSTGFGQYWISRSFSWSTFIDVLFISLPRSS